MRPHARQPGQLVVQLRERDLGASHERGHALSSADGEAGAGGWRSVPTCSCPSLVFAA